LGRKWSVLPLVEPDSLPELVLHPAESVWAYLFRCAETTRKTFKIRDPDEEMQALTLNWLASCNEEEVRERLKPQLAKLLRVSLHVLIEAVVSLLRLYLLPNQGMGLPRPERLDNVALRSSGRPNLCDVAHEPLPNRLEGDDLQPSLEDDRRLTSYHDPKIPFDLW
jgi:hypothetical protein